MNKGWGKKCISSSTVLKYIAMEQKKLKRRGVEREEEGEEEGGTS